MRYFFVYLVLMVLMAALIGCFESRPPVGATGELVGCVTAGDDLYCTTKYAGKGVNNGVDVLVGVIDYQDRGSGSFRNFALAITYQDTNRRNQETDYILQVISLRFEQIVGYHGPGKFDAAHVRVAPGDTVAIAITEPPTLQSPSKGYLIANLTRPEVVFEIPSSVGDIDILDLVELD